MSDYGQRPAADDHGGNDDGVVESLLRLAGPREPVPADRLERLRAGAQAEWRRQVAARRRRLAVRWTLGGVAAAAALGLAVRATVGGDAATPVASAQFAVVESLSGDAQLTTDDPVQSRSPLRVGHRLAVGSHRVALDTGTATLRLPGGAAVQLDRRSTLQLTAADVLELHRGAVYVDSNGTTSLEVHTPLGIVRDVGTKFEVRLGDNDLRVRVREGAVQVRRGTEQHDARPGDEVTLEAQGRLTRRLIPVDGPEWAWTTGAPPFELEGRSLREFLDWITAENGWRLKFADDAVEGKAGTTTLHGSIQGLTPEQALAAVLPTSGVAHQLDGRVLSIRLAGTDKD